MANWAQKARDAVEEGVRELREEEIIQPGSPEDLESGDGLGVGAGAEILTSWVKGAADRAGQALATAKEKSSSVDWASHVKALGGNMTQGLSKAADGAAELTAKAAGGAAELTAKAGAGISENAKSMAGSAKNMAGTAKNGIGKVGSSLSGVGALASPKRLMQFAAMFMMGMFLISMSLSFLPLLPIKPQKFSLLFAMGSMTMLGSVAWLRGFRSFAGIAVQREKLPFSAAYIVGLFGTFYATLVARSYLMTSAFASLQAVGLLYFMASFVPGGKAVLNFFGRSTSKGARALLFWRS